MKGSFCCHNFVTLISYNEDIKNYTYVVLDRNYGEFLIWERCAMSQRRISIVTQLTRMSVATVVLVFTVLGYTFYHYWMVTDQFEDSVNYATEKALDVSDSQIDFEEIVADIQDVFAYYDTTFMSVTGVNQDNLQAADDEWEEIYKYADKIQGK